VAFPLTTKGVRAVSLRDEQAHAISGAALLFGLAFLFYTGRFWPGILFVIGVLAIIQGLVRGQGWYALQGGAWLIGIGVWAALNFEVWFLFVVLGVSVLVGAFVPPPMLTKKPRPDPGAELE
jgi:hypothetical protein